MHSVSNQSRALFAAAIAILLSLGSCTPPPPYAPCAALRVCLTYTAGNHTCCSSEYGYNGGGCSFDALDVTVTSLYDAYQPLNLTEGDCAYGRVTFMDVFQNTLEVCLTLDPRTSGKTSEWDSGIVTVAPSDISVTNLHVACMTA